MIRSPLQFVLCLALVVAIGPGVRAQHAVDSLARVPESIDLAVCVEGGASLLRGDRPLIEALSAWGWAQETKPAFDELALRLGVPADVAFERLLGRRATLVIQEQGDASHWVVLSEVDRETARALPDQLDAKPLRISSTLPVQGLERRTFEFTVSPISPNTNTAWAILGPARASDLFDLMVGKVMGSPEGHKPLAKGAHGALFENAPKSTIALFYQEADPRRAALVSASRDESGWDVACRAMPDVRWVSGLLPTQPVAALPALSAPREGEIASVWSLAWSREAWLDGIGMAMVGGPLWECVMPLQSARGLTIAADGESMSLCLAAGTQQPHAALTRADEVLASKGGASSFSGELPGAVRTSAGRVPAVFGSANLKSLAWGSSEANADRPGWLVITGSTRVNVRLADSVGKMLQSANAEAPAQAGTTLTHGRLRPRGLIDSIWKAATPEGVMLARSIEQITWRLWQLDSQVRAECRIELATEDE